MWLPQLFLARGGGGQGGGQGVALWSCDPHTDNERNKQTEMDWTELKCVRCDFADRLKGNLPPGLLFETDVKIHLWI